MAGFLDRARKGTAADAKPEVKPNPLAGKTNPLASKKNPLGGVNPLTKKNIFSKPNEEEEAKTTPTEEAKTGTIEKVKTEEVKPNTEAKEEVKEEITKAEEPIEEKKAEEKKGASKKTVPKKSASTPVVKKEEPIEDINEETYMIPITAISFSDAVEKITSHFEDKEWKEAQKSLTEKISAIVINDDMNSATLKKVGADLDSLRSEVWLMYSNIKALFDELSSEKPEGLIERTKRISFTEKQKNDMDRRKVGLEACMKYKGNINLFEVLSETRERHYFLKELISQIDFKAGVLITMSSAIKYEGK